MNNARPYTTTKYPTGHYFMEIFPVNDFTVVSTRHMFVQRRSYLWFNYIVFPLNSIRFDDVIAHSFRVIEAKCLFRHPRFRYDAKKGFFCKVLEGGVNRCLGKGKGRQYAAMDTESYKHLREYYMPYNTALVKLLRKLEHTTIPQWLKDDLSYSSTWHLLREFPYCIIIIIIIRCL